MPDNVSGSDNRSISGSSNTEARGNCNGALELTKPPFQEHQLTPSGEQDSVIHFHREPRTRYSIRRTGEIFPNKGDGAQTHPAFQAFAIALSICILQAGTMLLGFVSETLSPLLMLYFYTSSPAQLLAWTGIKINGGFFGWPTNLGFGLGLTICGGIYFFAALAIIRWREKRIAQK